MQTEMDQAGDANGGDHNQDQDRSEVAAAVAADMHLTSLQLSNQRTSQNINTSSNQNHFRISNQFQRCLQACSVSRKHRVQVPHATVATSVQQQQQQQQLRLFKFNGRNARGDFTSEATPATTTTTTTAKFLSHVRQSWKWTCLPAWTCLHGLAWPGLVWSTVLALWPVIMIDTFDGLIRAGCCVAFSFQVC